MGLHLNLRNPHTSATNPNQNIVGNPAQNRGQDSTFHIIGKPNLTELYTQSEQDVIKDPFDRDPNCIC